MHPVMITLDGESKKNSLELFFYVNGNDIAETEGSRFSVEKEVNEPQLEENFRFAAGEVKRRSKKISPEDDFKSIFQFFTS